MNEIEYDGFTIASNTNNNIENDDALPAPTCSSLGNVYKSPLDPRKYKAFELPNGLKVVAISTLDVQKASRKSPPVTKTCHLRDMMRFNKHCIGLDSTAYKIRCECQSRGHVFADKSTSTVKKGSDNSTTDESSETNLKINTMKAIKALIYGEESKQDEISISSESTQETSKLDQADDDSQCCTAYLSVGAGWFNDPEEMPGMAHFVEHCFFLGSEKFQNPNQLFRLIIPHDGYANAQTSANQTIYTVSTSLEIFALALEMLGDAIGHPLLPRDLVTKEINAVDSEYSIRQDDIPKYNQLLASLAKDGHPLRKMDTGNKSTLEIPNFYERLIEWRKAHYSANYMTLALEGPMELEEMEELALRYFSNIPKSKDIPPWVRIKTGPESPFDPKTFHRIYYVPSIYHSEFMAIHWALEPEAWKNLSVKPLDYIGAIISSKGEGSLYQFLNYFGVATNVTAGIWESGVFCSQYASIFTIYVDLTDEGFLQKERILHGVFAYIDMICTQEPSQAFFQELQKQCADHFHHRAARDTTTFCEDVCHWLQNVPAKYVLVGPSLTTKFDPSVITKYANELTIDNCNIMIVSKKYQKSEMMSVETFYETPYTSMEFPEDLKNNIESLKPRLKQVFAMPKPNIYLQEITCCGSQQKNLIRNGPLMVVKGKCSIVYKDEKFKTLKGQMPQAKYVIFLHSPIMNASEESETMMELFAHFLNEMIDSRFSAALDANFRLHVKTSPGKLELSLTGPSHQLPQVLRDLFKVIIHFENLLGEFAFNIGKENYMERMDNIGLDNRVHAWEITNFFWTNDYQLSEENMKQAQKTTLQAFLEFVKQFKKKVYIAAHITGFITIEEAFNVVQTVSNFMQTYPKEVTPQEIQAARCPQLPQGESIIKIKSKNAYTSVVINGYQFGQLTEKENKIVNFLAKCMSDTAYNQLRTLEQLGYIVMVYYDEVFSVTSLFLELATQPKYYSTDYCNLRMDQFLAEFYANYLSDNEKYTTFMKGKPKVGFSLSQVQELYKRFLLPTSEYFRKLSVQIIGSLMDAFVLAQKAEMFRAPTFYFPNPQPTTEYAISKSHNTLLTSNNTQSADTIKTAKSKPIKRDRKNEATAVRQYRNSSGVGGGESHALAKGAEGTVMNPGVMSNRRPLSRLVQDIYKFKKSLELYPNPETPYKVTDSAQFSFSEDSSNGSDL